mgnify:CR=1 FL=1
MKSMISRRPDIMQGLPCIRGTRIPVRAVKNFADAGYSPKDIVREYPSLNYAQVSAAVAFGRRA